MASAESVQNKSFDFIICGGGAAGLVVASRLSENPAFNVLVIEAGSDRRDDPLIKTPGSFLQLYGKPEYDWDFKTTPQKGTNGAVIAWPRGKGLGGSSMINYMMYSHCSKVDMDIWRDLGNEGWGWEDILPYFQKVEHIHLPNDETREILSTEYIQPQMRGTGGPIQTSFPSNTWTWAQKAWAKQSKSMGYPTATDPRTGTSLGLFNQLCSIDPATSTRSYSASTYLVAAEGRPNLTVLTETLVTKVLLEPGVAGKARAKGVEIESQGQKFTIKAEREVILAAGTIQTPQILELSGVGRRDILEQHGVDVLIENENVGENLQDHTSTALAFTAKDGVETGETIRDNPEIVPQLIKMYQESGTGPLAASATTTGFLSSQIVAPGVDLTAIADDPRLPRRQRELLVKQLKDPKEAEYQVICMPLGFTMKDRSTVAGLFDHGAPGNYLGIGMVLTHAFSRGSVHIKSKDVKQYPEIDPNYLGHPLDLELSAYGVLHLWKMASVAPLSDFIKDAPDGKGKQPMPGFQQISTLEEAKDAVRSLLVTSYHPVGTAAMLPREEGGVVDSNLMVYGTDNLRVVDASTFPLNVQGNIMSLVYAVAEKASDLIAASHGGIKTTNGVNGTH